MSQIEKVAKTQLLCAIAILVSSIVLAIGLAFFINTYFDDLVLNRPTNEEITQAIETFDKDKLHRFIEFTYRSNRESAEGMQDVLKASIDVAFSLLILIGALALNYVLVFKKIRKLTNEIAH